MIIDKSSIELFVLDYNCGLSKKKKDFTIQFPTLILQTKKYFSTIKIHTNNNKETIID
jgi:hypothetical protein